MSHYLKMIKHKHLVTLNIIKISIKLWIRAIKHDASKFQLEEVKGFSISNLQESTYGTEDYYKSHEDIISAIDRHHRRNSHHPEYYENGVEGMDIVDLVEMICDWEAAVKLHNKGSFENSLEHNVSRFNLSPQVTNIVKNTINREFR